LLVTQYEVQLRIHYVDNGSLPLVPNQTQINAVHIPIIHFNIILPAIPKFLNGILTELSSLCYIPLHPILLDMMTLISGEEQGSMGIPKVRAA
jgi:hypothetical protein